MAVQTSTRWRLPKRFYNNRPNRGKCFTEEQAIAQGAVYNPETYTWVWPVK